MLSRLVGVALATLLLSAPLPVLAADGPPEQRRRDAARGAAAMLVRRLTQDEDTP